MAHLCIRSRISEEQLEKCLKAAPPMTMEEFLLRINAKEVSTTESFIGLLFWYTWEGAAPPEGSAEREAFEDRCTRASEERLIGLFEERGVL